MRTRDMLVLVCCCLLGLQASVFSAEAPYWNEASAKMRVQDYAGAYDDVQKLLDDKPDDVLLIRMQAVCLMETGHEDTAVHVLRRGLTIEPGSVACRYYLGQALAYQGSLVEAVSTLEDVLSMAPGSEYARRAEDVLPRLSAIRQTEDVIPRRKWWDVYLRVAGEVDDNVPARADNDEDTSPTDSSRFVYSVYGEVRPLDQRMKWVPVTLTLSYSLYQTLHSESAMQALDLLSHRGGLTLKHSGTLFSKPYSVRAAGGYGLTELNTQPFSEIIDAEAAIDIQWSKWALTTPRFEWRSKAFENDTDWPGYFSRDGEAQVIGLQQYVYCFDNRLVLGLAYAHRTDDTDGTQFRIDSHDVKGSLTLALPLKLRLHSEVTYRSEDYVEFVPDPTRLDDVWTFYGALSRPVWRDVLNIEVNYTATRDDSTLDFATYKRTIVGAALSGRL